MAYGRMRGAVLPALAGALLVFALGVAALVQPAFASTRDDLRENYQSAVLNYESVVVEQDRNTSELSQVAQEIAENERKTELTQDQIGDTAVSMYKGTRGNWALVDLLLSASSFSDAVSRYEKYEKIERYYRDKIAELERQGRALEEKNAALQVRKVELQEEAEAATRAIAEAELALLDNIHSDGAEFHQRQGVGNNCGATAFIVAVNTILHENRYTDNVAVWKGPGFDGDSTADLAYRGGIWLVANGLFDMVSIETVPGDIHSADEMRSWLEEGYVVVASSGSGSPWLRADGTRAEEGSFPDGHWIVFYRYEDGVFYANDSACEAAKGAGIPYDEGQMQAWLNGRGNHFATVLKKK